MSYLAIGITHEDSLTWSLEVESNQPLRVAELVREHNANGMPDEILLLKNGEGCPDVVAHWTFGKDF